MYIWIWPISKLLTEFVSNKYQDQIVDITANFILSLYLPIKFYVSWKSKVFSFMWNTPRNFTYFIIVVHFMHHLTSSPFTVKLNVLMEYHYLLFRVSLFLALYTRTKYIMYIFVEAAPLCANKWFLLFPFAAVLCGGMPLSEW